MAENLQPIYESGNSGMITKKLNSAGTEYVGEAKKWFSPLTKDTLVSVNITFTQESKSYASGNDPAHLTISGDPVGTGTITIFCVDEEEWAAFSNVDYSEEWGVGFAPDKEPVQFGFSYDVNREDGSKTKILVPRCQVTNVSPIKSTTHEESGKTIQYAEISVKVLPIYLNSARLPVYRKINSKKNSVGYNKLKDDIVLPISLGA